MQWIRQASLQNRIFFSMVSLTLALILVLTAVVYSVSDETIERIYVTSNAHSLRVSSQIVDQQLQQLIEIGRTVLIDDEVKAALLNGKEDGKIQFEGETRKVLAAVTEKMSTQNALIASIALMDLHGHTYFANNLSLGTYDYYSYWQEHSWQDEFWAQEAVRAKGKEVFYGYAVLPGTNEKQFCFVKYLINPSDSRPMGFMVIHVSRQLFKKSIMKDAASFQSSRYLVLEDDGTVVYFDGNEEQSGILKETYFQEGMSHEWLFAEWTNSLTGWKMIHAVNRRELGQDSRQIAAILITVILVMTVLIFIIARVIAARITRPLRKLEQVIESVKEGERHVTEQFDDSEVGLIGQKFCEMVNNNLELREHLLTARLNEREAELLLLQSQINPHFLYNTLDSLYCMAIIDGNDRIAEMTLALSDTFKLSLNDGRKETTVAEAMMKIEKYMKIQNMRYHDRFQLLADIPPEIMEKKIITFILQPFVENAIYHGLEPKLGKGTIRMTGRQEGSRLIFQISDDGVGIRDPEKMEQGYGIRNVRERISLTYGPEYGVTVVSREGEGTCVTIELPVE